MILKIRSMEFQVNFKIALLFLVVACMPAGQFARAATPDGSIEADLKDEKIGSKTNDNVGPNGFAGLEATGEKHKFEAEVSRLMGIIINSLYTNNDIFLREVLSNASDALDKLRFLSLTDPSVLDAEPELKIRVRADPENNQLVIWDTGIGMTREDLMNNLGTIAKSGTKDFLKAYQDYGDSTMIGQFGVGFYSVFLVADKVMVQSKHTDSDKQYVWISDADSGDFVITEDPEGNTLGRGTKITLQLKEDATEYTSNDALKALVKKYSEFLSFPIYLWESHEETKDIPLTEEEIEEIKAQREADKLAAEEEDAEDVDLDADADADADEAEEEEEEPLPTTKPVQETIWDYELMNDTKPLWTRSSSEITEEEYKEFYKAITKDYSDPLTYVHFSAEGEINFKALLFIPSNPPNNMFDTSQLEKNLKLYVRRVFITDDFESMLPRYLSFLRGVVDSDDLPLNVSRETLQQNRALKIIKKKIVRKAIAMFQDMKDDEELFAKFWEKYGTAIKYGIMEDSANKTRLSKLLMFHSSKTDALTSLEDYVGRMKKGQEQIYFLAGESLEKCQDSPLVERLLARGYEVLYMVDPIDEYVFQNLPKYDGKYALTNIARDGLTLPDDEKYEALEEELKERFVPLVDYLKENLAGVEKAIVSTRLTGSPSALVSGSYGYTANMQRIIASQTLADPSARSPFMGGKKILEINPRHPICVELLNRLEVDSEDQTVSDIANLLYDTAAVSSGFPLDNPKEFSTRIHTMMKLGLNLDPNAEAEQVPDEEAEDPEAEVPEAEEEELDEIVDVDVAAEEVVKEEL